MPNTPTPIYGFPQWQDGDHGWGTSVDQAFVSIENLIHGLAATAPSIVPISFVGGSSGGGFTGTTTIAQPSGIQASDVGVLVIDGSSPVPPSGWTAVSGVTNVYYKVYGASEASVVITGTPSAGRLTGALAVYRNVNTAAPFDTAKNQTTVSSGTNFTGTAVTSGYDNSICLAILSNGRFQSGTTETLSPPAGFVAAASEASNSVMVGIAHQNGPVNSGASTRAVGWSGTQPTTFTFAVTLLLRCANQTQLDVLNAALTGSSQIFNVDNPAYGGVILNTNTNVAGAANIAALNAAYTAATNAGGGIIQFPIGDMYFGQSSGSVFAVLQPLSAQYTAGTVTFRGAGIDATVLRLGGVVTSLMVNYASGNTYGNIVFENFTLDDNHVVSHSYSECGPLFTFGADSSLDNITWRNIKGINAEDLRPSTNGAPRRWIGISIGNSNGTVSVAPTSTHRTVTNLLFENVYLSGGNYGAQVNGISFTLRGNDLFIQAKRNGNFVPQSDVFADNIIFRNFNWAGNAAMASGAQGGDSCGIMVGQHQYGGRLLIDSCSVKNTGDDLIEINAISNVTIRKTRLENGHYEKIYMGNFGNLADTDQQQIFIQDCTFVESAGNTTPDIDIGGPVPHGHVTIRDNTTIQGLQPTPFVTITGGCKSIRVKDNNIYTLTSASMTAGSFGANYGDHIIFIHPLGGSGIIEVTGNHFIAKHSLLTGGFGSTAIYNNPILIQPGNHKVTIADNTYDANLTSNGGTPSAKMVLIGAAPAFTDPFNTFTEYIQEVGQKNWTTYSSTALFPTSSTYVGKYIRRLAVNSYNGNDFNLDWGPFNDVGNYVQAAPGAAVTGFWLGSVLKNVNTNTMIEGYVTDDGANSVLHIDKIAASPVTVTDGVLNTDATLSSATASFTYADVGRLVAGTGISLETYIIGYVDSSHVTLSKVTTATATGVSVTIKRETRTQLQTPVTLPSRLTASTYIYLRGMIQENVLTFSIHTGVPTITSTPITGGSITYTLTGSDIGTYGGPVDGYAGYSFTADDITAKIGSYATLGIGVASFHISNNGVRRMSTAMNNAVGVDASGFLGRVTKFTVADNDWLRLKDAGGTPIPFNAPANGSSVVVRRANINPDGSLDTVVDKFHAGAPITLTASHLFTETDSGKTFLYDSTSAGTGTIPSTLSSGWSVTVIQNNTAAMQFVISGSGAVVNSSGNTRTNGTDSIVSLLCKTNSDGSHAQVTLGGNTAA